MELANTILDIVLIGFIIAYLWSNHKYKKQSKYITERLDTSFKQHQKELCRLYSYSLNIIMQYYAEREMYEEAKEVQKVLNEMQRK